jgi:hypothetical protein
VASVLARSRSQMLGASRWKPIAFGLALSTFRKLTGYRERS